MLMIMATPFQLSNTNDSINDSEIFIPPDDIEADDNGTHTDDDLNNKKNNIFNWMELVITATSIVFFAMSSIRSDNLRKDMMIIACLGAFAMYSFLNAIFSSTYSRSPKQVVVFKTAIFMILIGLSFYMINSWWRIIEGLDKVTEQNPNFIFHAKFTICTRVIGSVIIIVDAILYAVDLLIMFLESKGYF